MNLQLKGNGKRKIERKQNEPWNVKQYFCVKASTLSEENKWVENRRSKSKGYGWGEDMVMERTESSFIQELYMLTWDEKWILMLYKRV